MTLQNPVRPDGTYDERVPDFQGKLVFEHNPEIVAALEDKGRLFKRDGLRARLPPLLALRHPAHLLRQVELVHPHDRGARPHARREREDRLAPRSHQARALRQVAGEQRRLGALARALLGHAAARSGSATPPTATRTSAPARSRSSASAAARSPTTSTAPTSTTSSSPASATDATAQMRRVPEVIDTWFDSGSMPFAQFHHPFEGTEEFEHRFPAQYVCEGIDQTRGWFYSLLAVSTLVFDQSSYENCVCLGLILDPEGQKMSKSKGNVVDPWEVLETLRRRRLPLVLPDRPAALVGLPLLGRVARRGDPPVPEHALEHVLVLGHVRERGGPRARRRRRRRPRRARGPISTAGSSPSSRRTAEVVGRELESFNCTRAGPGDRRVRRDALQPLRTPLAPALLGRRRGRARNASPLPARGRRACSRPSCRS